MLQGRSVHMSDNVSVCEGLNERLYLYCMLVVRVRESVCVCMSVNVSDMIVPRHS